MRIEPKQHFWQAVPHEPRLVVIDKDGKSREPNAMVTRSGSTNWQDLLLPECDKHCDSHDTHCRDVCRRRLYR